MQDRRHEEENLQRVLRIVAVRSMVTVCTVRETSNEGHIVAGLDNAIYRTMYRSVSSTILYDTVGMSARRPSVVSVEGVESVARDALNENAAALFVKRRSQLWWALLFNDTTSAAKLVRELSVIVNDTKGKVAFAAPDKQKNAADLKTTYTGDIRSIIYWSLTDRLIDGNIPGVVCPEVSGSTIRNANMKYSVFSSTCAR